MQLSTREILSPLRSALFICHTAISFLWLFSQSLTNSAKNFADFGKFCSLGKILLFRANPAGRFGQSLICGGCTATRRVRFHSWFEFFEHAFVVSPVKSTSDPNVWCCILLFFVLLVIIGDRRPQKHLMLGRFRWSSSALIKKKIVSYPVGALCWEFTHHRQTKIGGGGGGGMGGHHTICCAIDKGGKNIIHCMNSSLYDRWQFPRTFSQKLLQGCVKRSLEYLPKEDLCFHRHSRWLCIQQQSSSENFIHRHQQVCFWSDVSHGPLSQGLPQKIERLSQVWPFLSS